MQGNAQESFLRGSMLIMLRNALEDYLSSIKDERDFDFPLASLLRAMGYYDIHFTHGRGEIGKDFIAKKAVNGTEYQYAIQSKKGDINQSEFRNNIMGQLFEASVLGLSHPQFDRNLPRKVILVTSGRLAGNAPLTFQDFNLELETKYQKENVIFWGKDQLIDYFEEYGLTSIHQFTSSGVVGYTQFFLIYGKALDGQLSDREIENFSRFWIDESLEYQKRVLRASIEAEIIASKLIGNGKLYEAITLYLSLARVMLQAMFESNDEYIVEVYQQLIKQNILPLCKEFYSQFKNSWDSALKQLLPLAGEKTGLPMLHYLVWSARVLETTALYFFLTDDKAERSDIISFLVEFIETEKGCGHIPGDRYTVSVVWPALALIQAGKTDKAIGLLNRSVIWVCDRVEKGFGLAHYDADEYEETAILLGYPFESIKVEENRSSFLGTAAADLAAFIGDKEFYRNIINDLEACEIIYSYWQVPDTKAILTITTEECIAYPNIPHQYSLTNFEDFSYAEHIKHEPSSFQITEKAGLKSLILLSVLLKDRYFPKMWKQIISGNEEKVEEAAA